MRKGLTPVFCDIRESDYTLDPELLEGLITERTCAILPVHVYGCLCDADAIQTHRGPARPQGDLRRGATPSASAGTACLRRGWAWASMFSFHATKVYHTIEGGAVATECAELYDRLALVRNFGITGPDGRGIRGRKTPR